MENSASPISFPPLFSFLSLPSKTQDLSSWVLSLIDALSKGYEDFKVENQALKAENSALKEEMDGVTKLLEQKDKTIEQKDKIIEQKDKIIDSLTRRNQELENRLNTNSTNSNRPPLQLILHLLIAQSLLLRMTLSHQLPRLLITQKITLSPRRGLIIAVPHRSL